MVSGRTLALDIGTKRIGVALADGVVSIAVPYRVIEADGNEIDTIVRLMDLEAVSTLVIGYPRNQMGGETPQTQYVKDFVARLPEHIQEKIIYQDESLTSVHAEERLKAAGKPYAKGDIDMVAASLILQDYLELHHGRY